MKLNYLTGAVLIILAVAFLFSPAPAVQAQTGWTTLFDGKSLNGWNMAGNANWKLADGIVEATSGNGYLVTAASYTNFELRVEFWVDDDANSGIFLRCQNPQMIDATNAYEVNIYDKRPDQNFRTGAIVDVSKPASVINTGGRWNTFEITAQGNHLMVTLNGTKTVDARDDKWTRGPIGLQYGAGVVRFRSVQIRPL